VELAQSYMAQARSSGRCRPSRFSQELGESLKVPLAYRGRVARFFALPARL
jgi:hypothetical protein